MTIAEMNGWEKIKALFWLLFQTEEKFMSPEKLYAILEKSNIKTIRVTGRGGVEVSVEELKNSEQFKHFERLAYERVQKDLERLNRGEIR